MIWFIHFMVRAKQTNKTNQRWSESEKSSTVWLLKNTETIEMAEITEMIRMIGGEYNEWNEWNE